MSDVVCFRCRAVLQPADAEDVRSTFECAGCGGASFGGFRVTLNDLDRQRCKNGLKKTVAELWPGAVPIGSGPNGGEAP